ncbi:MAG: putative amidophosphoribosyltransferase [Bacteroidetes bacterium]|jgi:competence protein ComFC|nr:putative amidophosphoribosyltransferase [Bacteroidota bacterium]
MGIWNDFIQLFFPRLCVACEKKLIDSEQFLCLECLHSLPRTSYISRPMNPLEVFFAGRVPFERVASFAYFSKEGMLQKIVHELKYGDNPELGEFLGKWIYRENSSASFFDSIDCVVPVPLHPKRLDKRGYNQSYHIAKGLGQSSGIPVFADHLVRVIDNPSQTTLGRTERWANVKNIFSVNNPDQFRGKHILLVDDIFTTGSTLESCARQLLECGDVRLSILAVGSTI